MEDLRKVTEEVFYIKGVERSSVTSLFTPNVRYNEVVEDGFRGGNIVSADFAGTPEQLAPVRENLLKSDWVGRIVVQRPDRGDGRGDAAWRTTPRPASASTCRTWRRARGDPRQVRERQDHVHIIGFAKAMGDIAKGAAGVLVFFGVAFVITAILLYWYSGSLMLTSLALICAIVPVIWLLGLLPVFGLGLDPMSILVPFLIFSIAVSHAVQMTNAWKLETLHGADGVTASTHSFQKLFIPGAMALLANAFGFMVIAFVDIEIVRELAYTATIGVTVMIITNKMLLPILLSYYKFSPEQAKKLAGKETAGDWLWERIGPLATKKRPGSRSCSASALLAFGISQARHLHIGDLGKGVPELQPDARYNQDVEMITSHFAIGVDILQVIAEAKRTSEDDSPCVDREVMDKIEDFEFQMRQVDGVATVRSLSGFVKSMTQTFAETLLEVAHAARVAGADRPGRGLRHAPRQRVHGLALHGDADQHLHGRPPGDDDRAHRREDQGVQGGAAATRTASRSGSPAATSASWRRPTRPSRRPTSGSNLALFASVRLLCLITFRSFPLTLCVILPLALVTVLCNALMAMLGIGVKVNTLPVVALGVGVGVDYGIYLFERIKHEMEDTGSAQGRVRRGAQAARHGVVFTAVTMTISVGTWIFSALKFQADMGILLAFMFLVNVFGAILLLPALAAYLVGDRTRSLRRRRLPHKRRRPRAR